MACKCRDPARARDRHASACKPPRRNICVDRLGLEIGLLSRPRPNRRSVPNFLPDSKFWFARLLAGPGIQETPITAAIAIDASHLPGDFHADPMDRLIVTTARHLGLRS
jgi:hypothetical protein